MEVKPSLAKPPPNFNGNVGLIIRGIIRIYVYIEENALMLVPSTTE